MSNVIGRLLGLSLAAAGSLLIVTATTALGATIPVYASGHCDLCAGYIASTGTMELQYHFHNGSGGLDEDGNPLEGEIPASELYTRVSDATQMTITAAYSSYYSFFGVSTGSTVWALTQTGITGTPYLGFGTEELKPLTNFPTGADYRLISVTGPGDFFMWQDTGPVPSVYWASHDGVVTASPFNVVALGHQHANWGFTAPGVYTVEMQVSCTPAGGSIAYSDVEAFTFLVGSNTVVPEPGMLALLASGLGAIGLTTWRKRRQRRA